MNCVSCRSALFVPHRPGLLECVGCGLVLDPAVWVQQSNERLNEQFFETERPPAGRFDRAAERLRNQRVWKFLARYAAARPTLLEIGVGSGAFLEHARRQGAQVEGCDLSAASCHALERKQIPAFHGSLTAMPPRQFDAVVMMHVLEHTNDPLALLIEARRRLRPQGRLYLSVPNVACWEARLGGWNSYEPYHLIYFTPATLRSTLEHSGFEVIASGTHESFSGWFLTLVRSLLYERRAPGAGLTTGRRGGALRGFYHLLVAFSGLLSYPQRLAQAALGRGDEVYAVAAPRSKS